MADGLYGVGGSPTLTDHIYRPIPSAEPNTVKTFLLDGTPHYQTIGTPMPTQTVVINGTRDQMEAVNGYVSTSTPVQLNALDESYIGYIDEMPSWDETAYEYFTATITINVEP